MHDIVKKLGLLILLVGIGYGQQDYMQGRLILKVHSSYRGACTEDAIQIAGLSEALAKHGVYALQLKYPKAPAISLRQLKANPNLVDLSLVYNVFFDNQQDVLALCEVLRQHKAVVYADPEVIYQPMAYVPNDPEIAHPTNTYFSQIKAYEGWDIQQGNGNIVIGIVDASITWDHVDLQNKLAINAGDPINGVDDDNDGYIDNNAGWDFVGPEGALNPQGNVRVQPDNDTRPGYQSVPVGSSLSFSVEHGTWITGVACADTDNGAGSAGTGFNCRFLPMKLMHDYNGGGLYFTNDAIFYAATHDADVINLSLGSTFFSQAGQDVINFATFNEDCAVIAAAGNGISEQLLYPASYHNVLSVSSVNTSDEIANAYGSTVDVLAPGSAFTTFGLSTTSYSAPAGNFTSISCPIVAGLVGLVRAQFPDYTAQQAMEQVRRTCDDLYAINTAPQFQFKLGSGRVNFERALSELPSSVRLQNAVVTDGGDNVLNAGETFDLIGTFRNFLNASSNLQISVTTSDANITPISSNFNVGELLSQSDTTNSTGTFRFMIDNNAPLDHEVTFLITYTDGLSTDFELLTVTVNPSHLDIFAGNVGTSIGMFGKFGQNAYAPVTWQGIQYQHGGFRDYLWEGGFLIGNSTTNTANNLREQGGGRADHFGSLQRPALVATNSQASQEVLTRLDDSGLASAAQDLTIKHHAFAFEDDAFEDILLYEYTIYNNEPFTRSNQYASVAADWDFNNNALQDSAHYDAGRHMLYAWGVDAIGSRDGCNTHIGMVLLDHTGMINASTQDVASFTFDMANKFAAISGGTGSASLGSNAADVYQFLGVGPFDILPIDSFKFHVAIVSGCSLTELQNNADTIINQFSCLFKTGTLSLPLADDYVACDSVVLDGTTTGATGYAWAPGSFSNAAIQTIRSTGIYTATAIDGDGCRFSKDINITIVPTPAPAVQLSGDSVSLSQGGQLSFEDQSTQGQTWTWTFGDGFGFSGRSGNYFYQQEGSYPLRLIVDNGSCATTVDTTIRVIPFFVNRTAAAGSTVSVYPNPAAAAAPLYIQLPYQLGATAQLADLNGKRVALALQPTADGWMRAELPNVASGLYLLTVQTQQGAYQQKLILTR